MFTILLILEQSSEETQHLWLIMNTLLPALCAQLAALIIDLIAVTAASIIYPPHGLDLHVG